MRQSRPELLEVSGRTPRSVFENVPATDADGLRGLAPGPIAPRPRALPDAGNRRAGLCCSSAQLLTESAVEWIEVDILNGDFQRALAVLAAASCRRARMNP